MPQLAKTAWLVGEGGVVMYAQATSDHVLDSALARLICGISADFGEESWRWLRQSIYLDHLPTAWDVHLVKVCAKRLSPSMSPMAVKDAKDVGRDLTLDGAAQRWFHLIGLQVTGEQALDHCVKISSDEKDRFRFCAKYAAPRSVAAILCDRDGVILSAAVNTNAQQKIYHAEVNLMLAMRQQGLLSIPNGAVLYTSLKPCRMCAGLLMSFSHENGWFSVVSAADDPGSFGRHHLLSDRLHISQIPATDIL